MICLDKPILEEALHKSVSFMRITGERVKWVKNKLCWAGCHFSPLVMSHMCKMKCIYEICQEEAVKYTQK